MEVKVVPHLGISCITERFPEAKVQGKMCGHPPRYPRLGAIVRVRRVRRPCLSCHKDTLQVLKRG